MLIGLNYEKMLDKVPIRVIEKAQECFLDQENKLNQTFLVTGETGFYLVTYGTNEEGFLFVACVCKAFTSYCKHSVAVVIRLSQRCTNCDEKIFLEGLCKTHYAVLYEEEIDELHKVVQMQDKTDIIWTKTEGHSKNYSKIDYMQILGLDKL